MPRKFKYHPAPMKIEFLSCPVQASLRVLGREWAFLVLTSVALFRAQRYNEMLRAMPGLSKRLLSMRLAEREGAGFIVRAETRRGYVRWELTRKGADVVPILLTMVQFGSKWYTDEVFEDQVAHPLDEIFDEGYIRKTLGLPAHRASPPHRGSQGHASRGRIDLTGSHSGHTRLRAGTSHSGFAVPSASTGFRPRCGGEFPVRVATESGRRQFGGPPGGRPDETWGASG
jgi:DNA-binding HxlR family transcriptional regulator